MVLPDPVPLESGKSGLLPDLSRDFRPVSHPIHLLLLLQNLKIKGWPERYSVLSCVVFTSVTPLKKNLLTVFPNASTEQ